MLRDLDRVAKLEHRSRSELLREAFRRYFELRYGEVKPTAAELRALERGRAAMKRGDYLTLDELKHAVEPPRRKGSRKKA
jgi:predicted transcriptional regulator